MLAELLARGAILVDGLIEPAEPVEPLSGIDLSETETLVVVWGETAILLRREVDFGESTKTCATRSRGTTSRATPTRSPPC